jgi:hypothetical protein
MPWPYSLESRTFSSTSSKNTGYMPTITSDSPHHQAPDLPPQQLGLCQPRREDNGVTFSSCSSYQNEYRNPSSTTRGRLTWLIGTTPNRGEVGEVSGAPNIGVLVTL